MSRSYERKEVFASNHAKQRVKERCGISKKSADRLAGLALARGVEKEFTKGPLRKWLDSYYTSEDGKIVAYGDKAYIFSKEQVLITVLQIPAVITKNMSKMVVKPA